MMGWRCGVCGVTIEVEFVGLRIEPAKIGGSRFLVIGIDEMRSGGFNLVAFGLRRHYQTHRQPSERARRLMGILTPN